jgi:hypothetical protein
MNGIGRIYKWQCRLSAYVVRFVNGDSSLGVEKEETVTD